MDFASWLDLISGLDCNLLISITPAVSDEAFLLEEEYGLLHPCPNLQMKPPFGPFAGTLAFMSKICREMKSFTRRSTQ